MKIKLASCNLPSKVCVAPCFIRKASNFMFRSFSMKNNALTMRLVCLQLLPEVYQSFVGGNIWLMVMSTSKSCILYRLSILADVAPCVESSAARANDSHAAHATTTRAGPTSSDPAILTADNTGSCDSFFFYRLFRRCVYSQL